MMRLAHREGASPRRETSIQAELGRFLEAFELENARVDYDVEQDDAF